MIRDHLVGARRGQHVKGTGTEVGTDAVYLRDRGKPPQERGEGHRVGLCL